MADKGPGTSDPWVTGDVLEADDLLDTFGNQKWLPLSTDPAGATYAGVIAHSSSTYSAMLVNGEIKQTTDSGVTWTSRNTDLEEPRNFIRVCLADTTHGVAVEPSATAETAFTDDSGATWTTKTSATFATAVHDVSFATAALIVLAGDDGGGGNHIVYSTDDAGTWNDPTTAPSAACYCVAMYDANTGYAVDSANNIWKTTDGGDNWADTGHNIAGTASTKMAMVATSATVAYILIPTGQVEKYDNSAGSSTKVLDLNIGDEILGIMKKTNGDVVAGIANTTADRGYSCLVKSANGSNWNIRFLANVEGLTASDTNKCFLSELGTNHILTIFGSTDIIRVYDSD
jgi:photosystem II stability/assembly factor-like uncharacterized protein